MSANSSISKRLFEDIALLSDTLNEVIQKQAGAELAGLLAELYEMAQARRAQADWASQSLASACQQRPLDQIEQLVRAQTILLDLFNVAEELHRVRVLREREQRTHPEPLPESIAAAVLEMKQRQVGPKSMQRLLDHLKIEFVLTAHPTQSKRRTVLSKLRRIAEYLSEREARTLLPAEQARIMDTIRAEIAVLWATEPSRTKKLTVTDEVRTGLYTLDSNLWQVLPQIQRELEDAFSMHFPSVRVPKAAVRFGSWIGGDRDGNPYVTALVTAETIRLHRGLAVMRHRKEMQKVERWLSLSSRLSLAAQEFEKTLSPMSDRRLEYLHDRYPNEPYRLGVGAMMARLEQAASDKVTQRLTQESDSPLPPLRTAADLLNPLHTIDKSLREANLEVVADAELKTLVDQVETFGLHTARIDIRQLSRVYTRVMDEVLGKLDHPGYASLPAAGKVDLLQTLIQAPIPALERLEGLSEIATDTLALFRVAARAAKYYGPEILGPAIISMTTGAEDVLSVLLFARWVGLCLDGQHQTEHLSIAPLFETRDDLRAAGRIMKQLFDLPAYAEHLRRLGHEQTIMIGYSDSNKDAGFITAKWELYQTQESLAEICHQAGVHLTLFHGRGGTIARGGGPANQAIQAQPPASLDGSIRLTEQGEVIEERYGHVAIARRHIEQVMHAVLLTSAPECGVACEAQTPWRQAMDELAQLGYVAYRKLVYEDPDLLLYWQQATPIAEISQLHLGSRPAKRSASQEFSEVRAIPWVFSWLQSRHALPGFYGLGTALTQWTQTPEQALLLNQMYRQWPFFQILIDNAQLSVAKADMGIARLHAGLVEDADIRERIFGTIEQEHKRSQRWLNKITGQREILDNEPVIQRAIRHRNPKIDPLNFLQVELLRRLRQVDDPQSPEAKAIRRVVFGTILGIASGLKNTG